MTGYLSEIWKCRFFWLSLVKIDLRARYRGSVMGMGWSLVQPIAMTAILTVVFCKLFGQSFEFFAPFVMIGLTFWNFMTQCVVGGCTTFFSGEQYIRQHPAPMAIYPLRTTLSSGFHFGLALMLVVLLATVARGFPGILPLLSLIPTFVLIVIFGWSLAALFGMCNLNFRDTSHLSEIGLSATFYLTPILYPLELFAQRGRGRLLILFQFNPLVKFLDLLREPLLYGRVPALATFGSAMVVTALTFGVTAFILSKQERKIIFLF